ncbi:MAG: tRNA (adenosine(37)-N6)-threonylcarbamoyltransferase complex ATPase subunit type 1 TsaE [Bacteroidales bacterium]|nr:tRNA (adenosine(37)-N6)-threonylcarbamoyltransferase complex ATPase subunit type 1 TsaE [Bacteroidales bacterium]
MRIEYTDINKISEVSTKIIKLANHFRIWAFYGEMGVGKTTLIAELAKQLGSSTLASSPTFAIVNEYPLPNDEKIYHFDFYRLSNLHELIEIGFEDYLTSGNYCFMEWPEIAEPILNQYSFLKIFIEQNEKGNRYISINV